MVPAEDFGRENENPLLEWKQAKSCLCVVFSVVIRSEPFLDGDRGVDIPVGVVIEGAEISDPHNCMICML